MKTVYLAQPMGGRLWAEVVEEANSSAFIVEEYGFKPWCPPLKENVYTNQYQLVSTSLERLREYWKEDKAALARADGLISLRGDLPSEGVGLEIGMAKYKYKIPVVVVSPYPIGRVSHIEADYVAISLPLACEWLQRKFTRLKKAAKKKK